MSFRDLALERDAWVNRLRDLGVRKGDRVLLAAFHGLTHVVVSYALFKIGAVAIIANPRQSFRDHLEVYSELDPKFIVGTPEALSASRFRLGKFKSVRRRIPIKHARVRIGTAENATGAEGSKLSAEDPAAFFISRGQTGEAQAILCRQGELGARIEVLRQQFEIIPGELDLPLFPLYALLNPALGVASVFLETDKMEKSRILADCISELDISSSLGEPKAWARLDAYCRRKKRTLPSLKRILLTGAPVPPEQMESLHEHAVNARVYSVYGSTEFFPIACISSEEATDSAIASTARKRGGYCLGRPFPGLDLAILPTDADGDENEEPLPVGSIGEIAVVGEAGTREEARTGSWRRRMGDLGYLDGKRRLWYCGRRNEEVLTPYGTYFPTACEAIFNGHPMVRRCALIALQKSGKSIRPGLAVEIGVQSFPLTKREEACLRAELIRLGMHQERTRIIGDFFFLKTFPTLKRSAGKIDRAQLAQLCSRRWRT